MRQSSSSSSLALTGPLLLVLVLGLVLGVAGCGGGDGGERDSGTTPMDSGGRMDSSIPACSATGPEDNAAACNDGCDNEPDGFADCDDFGCCDLRTDCPATSACGMRMPPTDAGMAMACATSSPEDTLEACSDGCDNEPDRFADCDDFDCCDLRTDCPATSACGRAAMRDAGTFTRCDGGGATENTPETCGNGMDDDCDGFADCEDFGCCSHVTCGPSTACGRRPDAGPPRDAGPAMACDGAMMPENTLAACSDGCSNDGDRFVDCEDRDCCLVRVAGGSPCTGATYCAGFDPRDVNLCAGDDVTRPAVAENDATRCANDCDDDRDGYEDCNDRDCCSVRSDCPASTFCGRM